jgi:2-oxoglutarate dehydrogenase E2 component (dihydrolipoamide succinyltransferase)
MTTDVVMPQMGESIFEGTITKWLKKTGERVEKDEPLFEISTDKVDAEIPSPAAGVLAEIRIQAGATVEVNTVVAVIGTLGADDRASGGTSGANGSAIGANTATPQTSIPTSSVSTIRPTPAVQPKGSAAPQTPQTAQRTSPLVRRMAQENNVDLSKIAGTGSEGRITKEDVMRHLIQHGTGSGEPTAFTPKERPAAAPAASAQAVPREPQPLTKMRAIIAQRMVESMQTSPHVHIVYKVDMTRIVRLREREKENFERQHGVKLTYMPFIATAAIEALGKFPIVNASLVNGAIQYHQNIDLGIAVALEWGLIVPVVKQAEGRGFAVLARAIADLAARARAKKLLPEEASGSTFTLTNSGIFGEEFGTPIINQPESAILAIGGLRKEPVVMTDAEGNDTIAIRSVQYFCLGFDHRTIDGADAGKFMGEFKRALEGWDKPVG